MIDLQAYRTFLQAKVKLDAEQGLPCRPDEAHPFLKPHQRDMVAWAVRGGRRAIFAAFGLGKSLIQLETVRLTLKKAGGGRGLIVCPLGVRQEFKRDAAKIGLTVSFIRSIEEAAADGIYLTNYETVRDGKLDPKDFKVVSLDEASILRGFGGTKTFRELMATMAGDDRRDRAARVKTEGVSYRFVATATPSPNEFIELLAYAAFLGVMDIGQAKTRFFKRDSTKADQLTLHPHKEREFWLWVASWAMFVQRPSDLGHSDEGYALPPLEVRWHEIRTDHTAAGADKNGQGRLLRNTALGVVEASREKRESLPARVQRVVDLVKNERASAGVVSKEPGEGPGTAKDQEPGELPGEQDGVCNPSEEGPSEGLRPDAEPVSGHSGRPEGRVRDLRPGSGQREAEGDPSCGPLPHNGKGPGDPLQSLQHRARAIPGRSRVADRSGGISDQVIVWCDLNDEQRSLEEAFTQAGISFSSLYGSQSVEEREELLTEWRDRRTTVFLSKTSMYGAGVNLQQCHRMVFTGINFKFYEVIQGVHRIYRFLQERPCTVDFIYTEAERDVKRQLERKWAQHNELVANMTAIIREYGLSQASLAGALERSLGVERHEAAGKTWKMVNNDCVEEIAATPSDSAGLILTSIPFATQYEYTPSYNDFGHTDDNAHFWRQMDFLIPELLRVLQPGRVAAIHVKDRITPGGVNGFGFQTVEPFSDQCVEAFRRHGFAFIARKTIVTDVVRENNQTYRLGWTEQCKDGSRMGCGMPEYLLLFRKAPTDRSRGYADVPVVKSKEAYTRARWQIDAHGFARSSGNRLLTAADLDGLPHEKIFKLFREFSQLQVYDFKHHVGLCQALEDRKTLPVTFMLMPPQSWHPDVWTDVTRMRTLNSSQHSKGKEMHLCPLQLDIVDRVIEQMSNPEDLVLDPFGGLGTVPLRAVQLGRRGFGIELNPVYWADAVSYLKAAEYEASAPTLFDLEPATP